MKISTRIKYTLLLAFLATGMWLQAADAVHYLHFTDGRVVAFPDSLLASLAHESGCYTFRDLAGNSYSYADSLVDYQTEDAPGELPEMLSFRFDHRQNGMLMQDAEGSISPCETADSRSSDTIRITAGGIGKRLVPSFLTSGDDDSVFVGTAHQISAQTSQRFSSPVVYTVCLPGWRRLCATAAGCAMMPFGHEYTVCVSFLSDSPTTAYGIPEVYIRTSDGRIITSKETYKEATIRIDGAGYYPDMQEKPVEIRGRGNTSWQGASVDANGNPSKNPKNPYRLHFQEKNSPLGMKAGKNWCLIAQSQYGSMTTNPIGQRIADVVGCLAPCHYIPVELYINGDYRGQYCFTEKVGFGNNSIDLSNDSTAVLLELDSYYDETYKFHSASASLPVNIKEPDLSDSSSVLTKETIRTHFNRFATAVYNGDDITPYADPVSLARYLMVNDLIYNIELMHPKSTYLFVEDILSDTCRYRFGPIWDLDWSFGYMDGSNYFQASVTKDFWTQCQLESTAWMRKLRYSGEETNREYYRTWIRWRNSQLDDILEYADDYYALVASSLAHDHTKWGSGGESFYATTTTRCKSWLKRRTSYVCNYLSNTLGYADKGYVDDDELTDLPSVSAEQVTTYPAGIYDLLGRRVSDDIQALPPGVYIRNGQKVMVP